MTLLTKNFEYFLPDHRIAQAPMEPRDHSRLMVVDKKRRVIQHEIFSRITEYLKSGDLLVWNNSKVFKARLFGKLVSSTGRELLDHARDVEIFLIRPMENDGVWKVLGKPGKHIRPGSRIIFADDFVCEAVMKEPDGTLLVQFGDDLESTVREKANRYGVVPLPPYIKDEKHELEAYQTVYANPKQEGSVAAPTAGFHFTERLIQELQHKGVEFADITLHVGLGTFLPVKTERVEDHTMHAEWVEVREETAQKIRQAKQEGRRVIAVGTTTVRTLEAVAILKNKEIHGYTGDINLFITPGFEFHVVDALITNFHLPKSTLLMLVSAFIGDTEFTLDCYKKAVEEKYRFYSFGDAMFIH